MLEPIRRIGQREPDQHRPGAEDAEPDNRIEAADAGQAEQQEVRLPEPVEALAPHACERRDAEDGEQ